MAKGGQGHISVRPLLPQKKIKRHLRPARKVPAGVKKCPVTFRFDAHDNEAQRDFVVCPLIIKHTLQGVVRPARNVSPGAESLHNIPF